MPSRPPLSLPSRPATLLALTLSVLACTRAPRAPATVNAPSDIPLATARDADTLLIDVHAFDPSIVVDMRYATTDNFTGAVLPGYEANRAWLHRDVARSLARVQRALARDGLGLKIFDAYRPVRASQAMVAWTQRTGRTALIRDGYIADRSRHNLGVAVDLTLIDRATGRELDMGTPFDTFSAAAHTANATGTVRANRDRLARAMAAEGFAPYDKEWWHFSYPIELPRRFDLPIVPLPSRCAAPTVHPLLAASCPPVFASAVPAARSSPRWSYSVRSVPLPSLAWRCAPPRSPRPRFPPVPPRPWPG
ncbi:MAG: M15 family metallopeptidase [Gemmatimonadaceae bacterium]|nr:M15 family metallopeptidase [Gemmatimonadaceae bacterium]